MIVYSANGEDYNDTEVNDVIQTIVNHLEEGEWFVGATFSYHKADAVKFTPRDFVNVDNILEDIACQADDEGGEYAEGFAYCDKDAQDELEKLVGDWAEKHLECHFYGVKNSEEVFFTVDEEMFKDYS